MKSWWTQIKELKEVLKITTAEREMWKLRVLDMERSISRSFGIKVRHETIVVNSDYSKVELAVMQVGVSSLLKDAKNSDDIKFYADLKFKIQNLLDKMEE